MMLLIMNDAEPKPTIEACEKAMLAGGIGAAGTVLVPVLFLAALASLRHGDFAGLAQLVGAPAGLFVGFCLHGVLGSTYIPPSRLARRWLDIWFFGSFTIAGGLLFGGVIALFSEARWWVLAIIVLASILPAIALALRVGNQPLAVFKAAVVGAALATALLVVPWTSIQFSTPDSVLLLAPFAVLPFAPAIWLAVMTLLVLRMTSATQLS